MDPIANLDEQLTLSREIQALGESVPESAESQTAAELDICLKAGRLAELVLALDEWIRNGGFLPVRWEGR